MRKFDLLLEPKLGAFLAVMILGYVYYHNAVHNPTCQVPDLLNLLEFIVLMVTLYTSQENYQRLFSDLGHIANAGHRLPIFSPCTYYLRWHHLFGLIPIASAVVFLSYTPSLEQANADHYSTFLAGAWSMLYVASLSLLYAAYCFTNRATLRFLSDTLTSNQKSMCDAAYASRFMTQVGNNVLYYKNENRPALIGYILLFIISLVMVCGKINSRDIALFIGGAATAHVAISAYRFAEISRDMSQKEETERDAIELIVAHMSPIFDRLKTLQHTLSLFGQHLWRSFVCGLIFALAIVGAAFFVKHDMEATKTARMESAVVHLSN